MRRGRLSGVVGSPPSQELLKQLHSLIFRLREVIFRMVVGAFSLGCLVVNPDGEETKISSSIRTLYYDLIDLDVIK